MRPRRVAVAVLVAAGSVVMLAAPARADAQLDGSWWSEANTGLPVTLPVAVPTLAVTSDLTVQELPNGPAAVAGIRVAVAAGTVPATLTVHLVSPATGVSLAGCATTGTWASASAGPWAIRPTCSGPVVPVVLSADGTTGTLDVSAVDQARIELDHVVEVLIAPAAGSTAFTVTLSPPVATDLVGRAFTPPSDAPAATLEPTAASPDTPAPAPDIASPARSTKALAAARPRSPVPAARLPQAAPPAVTGVAPTPVAVLPTVAPVSSAEAVPQPVVAAASTATPVSAPQSSAAADSVTHTNRRLPALLLLVLALVSVAAFPMRTRVPVLLTSRGAPAPVAPVDQAGLGRHRKPRTGRPPRL